MEAKEEDLRWLKELNNQQLLGRGGKPLPEGMKERLIMLGWVREKLGGLQITLEGKKAIGKQ